MISGQAQGQYFLRPLADSGSGGGALGTPPLSVQFIQFLGKNGQNNRLAHPFLGLAHSPRPIWEILDPPVSEAYGARHDWHNVMAYFHQQRRRWRRTPVQRVSLIVTLYYAELFPLVRRPRRRLSLMVTVPILGTDLHPRDRSPSQFYYILIRGLESISIPVEKPAQYNNPCGNPSPSPLVEISH